MKRRLLKLLSITAAVVGSLWLVFAVREQYMAVSIVAANSSVAGSADSGWLWWPLYASVVFLGLACFGLFRGAIALERNQLDAMNKTLTIIFILSFAIVILSTSVVLQGVQIQKLRSDNANLQYQAETGAEAVHYLNQHGDYRILVSKYDKLQSDYNKLQSDYNKLKSYGTSPQPTPIAP